MADRRILVTGAGGFIGARLVEVLHCAGGWQVVAGVRRWSTAARVARFPVSLAQCDIRNAAQVRQALQGVTHTWCTARLPGTIGARLSRVPGCSWRRRSRPG
jgi:uncharacterized protein YbjT (DUF2867 family)